jgi:predicted RNA-binding protein with PIN domain
VVFLIDGYNLMHAVGLLGPGPAPGGLDRARTRLLDWLADTTEGRGETLRVVFDAQAGPAPSRETVHRGVRVLFAFRRTADDLIEQLLAAEPVPARVTVVSNDNQVRETARRRGSAALTCAEFVDWCIEETPVADAHGSPEPPEAEKPEPGATADEMAAWLAAFSLPKRKPRKE